MSMLGKIFEVLENAGRIVLDGLVYALLFLSNPGHTWSEVRTRKLVRAKPIYDNKFALDVPDENVPLLFDEAKGILQSEESRRQVIDDKSKVLLTVGSLLLAANAVLLTKLGWGFFSLLPAAFIFIAVFLVLAYFRIGSFGFVDLPSMNWASTTLEVKRQLSRDIIASANHLEPQNAFRVGVYRGALRSMILGVLVLAICFITAQRRQSLDDSQAIQFLENHKELRDALTGPQGPKGDPGPPGPPAEQGPADASGSVASTDSIHP